MPLIEEQFWGLELIPNEKYQQKLKRSIRITMASLGLTSASDKNRIYLEVNGKESVLCTLAKGSIEQQPLANTFSKNELVSFWMDGDSNAFLTGNFLMDTDALSQLDDESDSGEFEATPKKAKLDEKSEKIQLEKKDQKVKSEKIQTNDKSAQKTQPKEKSVQPPNEKKSPKQAVESQSDTALNIAKKMVQPHKSGVEITDIVVGTGNVATSGKKCMVAYVGKLTSGKIFDQSHQPFKFKLGAKEVIRGWDEGVKGMKVGGVRRLIVQPDFGYGNSSVPGIPKNSVLDFTVTLKKVL